MAGQMFVVAEPPSHEAAAHGPGSGTARKFSPPGDSAWLRLWLAALLVSAPSGIDSPFDGAPLGT